MYVVLEFMAGPYNLLLVELAMAAATAQMLLLLLLPSAQLLLRSVKMRAAVRWQPPPHIHLFNYTRERRYSTHTGRSSGPLTGEASMDSRPA